MKLTKSQITKLVITLLIAIGSIFGYKVIIEEPTTPVIIEQTTTINDSI